MQNTVALVIVVAIIAAVLMPFLDGKRGGKGGNTRVYAKPLMTGREVAFWRLLRQAAEPFHVAPQVAMGALLRTS